jgi:hypothetical protein
MGKQMTAKELSKALFHGETSVKAALRELHGKKMIRVVSRQRGYDSSARRWAIVAGVTVPKPAQKPAKLSGRQLVLDALKRGPKTRAQISLATALGKTTVIDCIAKLSAARLVRICSYIPRSRGAAMPLYDLSDGRPDAVIVEAKPLSIVRKTVVVPRRDPAAAWF